ncbi:hypothetical protein ACFQ7F_17080 [Streptomyces sp. NPDC056486]|uniref:hypothetical protein n=1 Tax=Streptomyces sp. NPDC056486 TaxID=3345835 RepID=UPI003694C7CE
MFALDKKRPQPGTTGVCDKGFTGADFEAGMAELGIAVIRPARKDEVDMPASSRKPQARRVTGIGSSPTRSTP